MLEYTATTTNGSGGAGGILFVVGLIVIALYLLPTIIAFTRRVPNAGSVAVINVLLGWSLIGWAVALSMAARSKQPPHPGVYVVNNGQPPSTLINGLLYDSTDRPLQAFPQPPLPRDPGAAGWFPDPGGDPGTDRFFDGQRWTPTTRPRQTLG